MASFDGVKNELNIYRHKVDGFEALKAEAEKIEICLLVSHRRYGVWLAAASCIAATGLVYQIHSETTAQENVLKSLAAIRCCFPGFRELP